MKFDKLYANASNGKIKTWEIESQGNIMVIKSGYIDGKLIENKKEISGKNIGKSCETSDEEQCISECKSKWKKKLDQQYTNNRNNIKEYSEQQILLPMLAQKYNDRKHYLTFPCYIQPKLNGVRCIYQNGKFMSRNGKEYTTLKHLIPNLRGLGINIPDGEIYIHGMEFQEIIRRVKKYRAGKTEELQYWIYDQINERPFDIRHAEILSKFSNSNFVSLIQVPTYVVNNEKEIKEYHNRWVREGFEGAIIRNTKGLYKIKHRSNDLLKYKEFIDDEFVIVGGHEGEGLEKGAIIFEVETKEGETFSVRPKGTREIRIEWMNNIKSLIGKKITIRYQNLSEDGIPIFPVGIAIRDYE